MLEEKIGVKKRAGHTVQTYPFEFKKKVIEKALLIGIPQATQEFKIKATSTVHSRMKR